VVGSCVVGCGGLGGGVGCAQRTAKTTIHKVGRELVRVRAANEEATGRLCAGVKCYGGVACCGPSNHPVQWPTSVP